MVWEGSACEGALYPIPAPERSGMICRSNFARVLRMINDLFSGELLPPDAKSKPATRQATSAEAVVGRNFLATLRGDDGTTASSPEKLQAAAGQASHRLLQGARRVTFSND